MDSRNIVQRLWATLFLMPNYALIPGVKIVFDGVEHVPTLANGERVILAMNHTDRYNYWPLMYKLWRVGRKQDPIPFVATWVKGKYFRHPVIAKFLTLNQGIVIPSLMYLIEEFYKQGHGRYPKREEYKEIRDVVEGERAVDDPGLSPEAHETVTGKLVVPEEGPVPYPEAIRKLFIATMARAVRYTREASEKCGFNLLIFPEGTRSVRIGAGRTGLMEYALAVGQRVVPIGSSNCDRIYPGNSPWGKRGTVTYRFGEPYDPRALLHPDEHPGPYTPFTDEARPYRAIFERLTEDLMRRINALVDER
ncbi:MAG: hypothetical protein KC466_09065, partial [Myxococcales bacterium]|nr:hypothetical protein [Myxococcales bacterium]